MHNKDCFWKPFRSERVNESRKLVKSSGKYFYPTFSSFWAKLSLKNLFLMRSEILLQLLNTLTPNYEYSRSNKENLPLQIQVKLSIKPPSFLLFFLLIFGIYVKLPLFWKQHGRHRSNISEVIDSKRCAYLNA